MDSSLTNLMPPERLRALERERVIRGWAAGLWATLFFVLLNILLLVPAYFYLSHVPPAQTPDISDATTESPLEARLKDLLSYAHEPRASEYMRAIFEVPHPGIRLTAFTYAPRTGGASTKLTLSGDAKTREDLLQYDRALNDIDGIQQAKIPVSAYSRTSDIHFTFDVIFDI